MTLNPMDLSGRTFVVTGASAGIGRATAVLLSQLGGRLVLVGRDEARLEEARSELVGEGHVVAPFDLTQPDEIPVWLRTATAEVAPLHGLVHAAGVHSARPLRVLAPADFEAVMRTNVTAAAALARGFRQKGVAAQPGSIVFVSSVTGLVGQPGVSAYAASKGAVIALTRALAVELAREQIRVNCVAPAVVETDMTKRLKAAMTPEQAAAMEAMHPLGTGEPIDVANAIAFLLADTARWITGSTLIVDGGYTAH